MQEDQAQPSNRTSRLFVRLTEPERAALEREAQAAGLTLSELVRSRVLKTRQPGARAAMARAAEPGGVSMSPPLFAELSRIGNNLNQLARAFNATRDLDRAAVLQLAARAWSIMLTDEVTARYAMMAETKVRPR